MRVLKKRRGSAGGSTPMAGVPKNLRLFAGRRMFGLCGVRRASAAARSPLFSS
jgi:hypothetical protein